MAKLEDLTRGVAVKGILPDCFVTVIDVKWYGSAAVELTYKDPSGKPSVVLLYRDREPTLEIGETGRPWSFDGDGKVFRLVSEAHRINLAHLFDPLLAIHTSMVDPLPHQITAVYGEMLPRQPLRFLLADDPGAGKGLRDLHRRLSLAWHPESRSHKHVVRHPRARPLSDPQIALEQRQNLREVLSRGSHSRPEKREVPLLLCMPQGAQRRRFLGQS
jgi:hypothetical protein